LTKKGEFYGVYLGMTMGSHIFPYSKVFTDHNTFFPSIFIVRVGIAN